MGSRNRNSFSTSRNATWNGWKNMSGKIFLLLLPAAIFAQWTPELSMKVKTVTAPVPSPDGRLCVWTQTQSVMDGEKSETLTHVFLSRADGSGRMPLTRGDKSANAPSFSPDSAWV